MSTSTSGCRSTLDWQVWNGDELLFESRDVESGAAPGQPNFDGTVVYTHGARLDVPLSVARHSYTGTCDFTISPHADWRGRLAWGSFDGSTPSCASVDWPGNDMMAYRQGVLSDATAPWNGSLIAEGADESGLQYMRNRYYDPSSGQFSQPDPIGVAGGLNVYGYGGGDPVNYSDPFGLKEVEVGCRPVEGSGGAANHCAVRVGVGDNKQAGELLKKNGKNSIRLVDANDKRYKWTKVAVPKGMTEQEFDAAVIASFNKLGPTVQGRDYTMWGDGNSNKFIFDVISGAGGVIPAGAVPAHGATPGLCGGSPQTYLLGFVGGAATGNH